jgi:pyrimidine deaminase RibD-like protein
MPSEQPRRPHSAGAARDPGRTRAGDAAVDLALLGEAVGLAWRCPPSAGAYSVGAIVVAGDRRAEGWSRATGPHEHAEEVALAAFAGDPAGGTLYTSLEPCSQRRSKPRTCTDLVLAAGLARVVLALREPPLLADCHGAEILAAAGVEVVELPALAAAAREVNAHLLG